MGFAKFLLGEPFGVKSHFKRPETEMGFALELGKVQGSIAEAGVQGGQEKWWVSTVVTAQEAAPQSCFWHLGPFLGYSEWTVIFKREKKMIIESIRGALWVISSERRALYSP